MQIQDHAQTALGRVALWGGVGLGLLLAAGLLTGGFGLLGRRGHAAPEAPAMLRQGERIIIPAGSALRARLTVVPAAEESVSATLNLPGIVESDPARTAAVLTPLGGRVLALRVALGDRVQKGQALAVIDSSDLAQAYDENDKAASVLALARKNLERQEGQFKIGAASSRDVDQARSDHLQAQAEYTRTQARLKMLGARLGDTERSSVLTVSAPVSGSITSLSVANGNMINDPTQPIMTVADLSTVWVAALVPEKDLDAVAKGQDAEVHLNAYPGEVRHGTVLFVSDVIEPDSRRNKVRIAFLNADSALKPNMFATVRLRGTPHARVVLPTSALLMNNDRTTVFVATAPWTFERRTVDVHLEEGPTVAIGSGVKAGEPVVVKGGVLLND
jgi:cobalt-zinc-cadmium efflux system membrane fusion protein